LVGIAVRKSGCRRSASASQGAISTARQQQAKSWELRASISLARLWRGHGKVQQARELLAPGLRMVHGGVDTRDLKEAKALLEELAA
jgi:predicted ATPase